MVTPGWFLRMCLGSREGESAGRGMDIEKRLSKGGVSSTHEAHSAPSLSLCCLETFGENANESETEGLHHCMNSYTNTAATTTTQISVVKWLIMITTDNLMAALI